MPRSLAVALAVVIAVMTALAVIRWNLWTYGTDTGTFAQVALNAFHGFTDGPERGTHFRFHWSPILALLWPIVALTRTSLSIQIVQVVLIALSAVPLAAIVRAHAGNAWAVRAGVLALIYPPLLSAAFEEFHELAFYPLLALTLFWAADRARWGWFAIVAIAITFVREDACLDLVIIGTAFGILGFVKRHGAQTGLLAGEPMEPRRLAIAGFGLAALNAAALVFYASIVAPRAGGWVPSAFYHYPFANGPLQTALAVFSHPIALGSAVFTFGRLTYLLEAFAPLAFLPFLSRWVWLAVPGLAGVLLASNPIVWHMGFHYELLWAPWLLLAAVCALIRISRTRDGRAAHGWWRAAVAACAVVLLAFDPMHPAHYLAEARYQQSASVKAAFACAPHDAPVATHDEWFAHVALAFPRATNMDDGIGRFKGYVVYTPDWRNTYVERHVLPQLRAARASGRYSAACTDGNVVVLRPSRRAE